MRILRVITALAALGAVSACAQAPVATQPLPQPQPVVQTAPAPQPFVAAPVPEVSQPVVVYFDLNKAEISASTMQILYGAMPTMKAAAPKIIRIHGFTDASGKAAYNQALSQKRAMAVADQLRKLGIAADKIEIVGHGSGPAKKGPKDQSKRRVEITWESSPQAASLSLPDQVKTDGLAGHSLGSDTAKAPAATTSASVSMVSAASPAPREPSRNEAGTGVAPASSWAGLSLGARGPPASATYI